MSEDRERDQEQSGTGFTVRDRRAFSQEQPAEQPATAPASEPAGGPSRRQQDAAEQAAQEVADKVAEAAAARGGQPMPDIDFGTFIISLSTSALYHLGVIPDPESGTTEPNLPLAKQTIDILGMLRDKTEGNRTPDESNLIENLLYDLRLRYVNAGKK